MSWLLRGRTELCSGGSGRAATEEFGRLGYGRAKTSEVSVKAGMSIGSQFTYVESKEAPFELTYSTIGHRCLDERPSTTKGADHVISRS